MLEFNLSQNMMSGTKLSHPNGRIQFCPMEDTFVHSIANSDRFFCIQHMPLYLYVLVCSVRIWAS
jgi:hypothetical protein